MDGQLRIESMWAFTLVDADGTEGVCGMHTKSGWLPLVGADLAMVALLRPHAQMVADQTRREVRLVHFSQRTEADVLTPGPARSPSAAEVLRPNPRPIR